ncbi:LysE family translocator [Neogemmobacter tilapiae]|uniref:Threonine transporter RhtB n=1 Tax=Neogemmobacter tilapiae TaxID=875041 RepID=A0A918WJF5_9RHOB|nr:LysE family translocator [Gemmobacter tilapiae]GHC51988.1 threonine transporter RhtB [Gemmobacter tilapiae]
MTVSLWELGVYALAMAGLWVVPGPVWVALIARALSGGFASAWPLAVGVVLGDLIWPICAIFGLSWVLSVYGDFLSVLRWVASGVFVLMGAMLIRKPAAALSADSRLTKPGRWAGFLTGLAAVIGNPKAILFYMGVLPGFFNLGRVTAPDIAAILFISALVPLLGNLVLALFVDRARALISSPENLHRINIGSGLLLILVGVVIVFT